MNDVDWIRLWLLNDLVPYCAPLSRLVNQPEEGSAVWNFPSYAFVRAPVEVRLKAVEFCLRMGWIDLYHRSELGEAQTAAKHVRTRQRCKLKDVKSLDEIIAVLTHSGHQWWESKFEPDWSRFWRMDQDDYNSETGQRVLTVTFASNKILKELVRALPVLLKLSPEAGLTQISCRTLFCLQATTWKVIPVAKTITWEGQSVALELNSIAQMTCPLERDAEGLSEVRMCHLERVLQRNKPKYADAFRTLCRLSKKWDVIYDYTGNGRFGIPKRRKKP